jgi:hypothetical protein
MATLDAEKGGGGGVFLADDPKDAKAAILPPSQASPYCSVVALFFKFVGHLAIFIINATSSLLPSPSFSCYAAITIWPRCRTAQNKATKAQLALTLMKLRDI